MTDPHWSILEIDFTDVGVLIAHVDITDEYADLAAVTEVIAPDLEPGIVQDLEGTR